MFITDKDETFKLSKRLDDVIQDEIIHLLVKKPEPRYAQMDLDSRVALMHLVDTKMSEENKRIFENLTFEKRDEKRVIFFQIQDEAEKELNSIELEDSYQ